MLEGAFGFISTCTLFLPLRTNTYTFRKKGASNLLRLLEHGVPVLLDLVQGVMFLDQLVEVLVTPDLLTFVDCFLIIQYLPLQLMAVLNFHSEDMLQEHLLRGKCES